jgi:hypothetical protein
MVDRSRSTNCLLINQTSKSLASRGLPFLMAALAPYRRGPVRFFFVGLLAFFDRTLFRGASDRTFFRGAARPFRDGLTVLEASSSSAASSSMPISEPVAATLAALAMSVIARPSLSPNDSGRFFLAMLIVLRLRSRISQARPTANAEKSASAKP